MLPLKQTLENTKPVFFRGRFMSQKAKYRIAQKMLAAERYTGGEASTSEIAAETGMTKNGKRQRDVQ